MHQIENKNKSCQVTLWENLHRICFINWDGLHGKLMIQNKTSNTPPAIKKLAKTKMKHKAQN